MAVGQIVVDSMHTSVQALRRQDEDMAQTVIEQDDEINAAQIGETLLLQE